ncbi:MAG TPA: RNA methyltransferase [Flavobacteriales bacterium]|nr:RNA methyltransferase [Flavobacteriales bacterium]
MNTGLTKGQIQFIKELQQKEGRKLHGLFIVEGEKLTNELACTGHEIKHLYYTTAFEGQALSLIPEAQKVTEKELERITCLTTPNKVLALVKIPTHTLPGGNENKIIYCCQLQDPGNAGTILRIADWYGLNKVIFSANSVDVFSPKVVQASMGAVLRINCSYDNEKNELLDALKLRNYAVIAADMQGKKLGSFGFPEKTVLVMGSESHGISNGIKNRIDEYVTIERAGKAESLNVGVACGIICQKMIFN